MTTEPFTYYRVALDLLEAAESRVRDEAANLDFSTLKVGQLVKLTGLGWDEYAMRGELVTIEKVNEDGEPVFSHEGLATGPWVIYSLPGMDYAAIPATEKDMKED